MSLRRAVLAAACAALALPAPEAPAVNVTAVSIEASPASSTGPCPATFRFHAKVVLSKQGTFTYRWERSDGAADAAAPRTGAFDGAHATGLSYDWGPLAHSVAGWVTVRVLTPENRSATARFTLTCPPPPPTIVPGAVDRPRLPAGSVPPVGNRVTPATPGGSPSNCNGRPDLVPLLHAPMDGWVGVKNAGAGDAGPSRLLIKCTKDGYTGPGGGCVEVPASSLALPFFPAPGYLVGLNVPAIPCGKEMSFPAAWWQNTKWPAGTYRFTAIADVGNTVDEGNEGNNTATATLVRP